MRLNHTTLCELVRMDARAAAELPLDQLHLLQTDVAEFKSLIRAAEERLSAALELRFGEFADKSRKVLGKDTGTVRWDEGDFVVVADKPKAVVWDQAELAKAEEVVRAWGEPVAEYMTIKRTVHEAKYLAWPASIRQVFEPARTVKHGRCNFELVPAKKDAA